MRGFADQRLRKPDSPLDPSNRCISLIVQYLSKLADGGSGAQEKNAGTSKASDKHAPANQEASGAKPAAAQPAEVNPKPGARKEVIPWACERGPLF